MKEYLRKYMKSQSNNVFKKIKKNNDLKSVEHSVVTKLIKDEQNFLLMMMMMMIMIMDRKRSLDSDRISVT